MSAWQVSEHKDNCFSPVRLSPNFVYLLLLPQEMVFNTPGEKLVANTCSKTFLFRFMKRE